MKKLQQGFGMAFLIVSLAVLAIMIAMYFSRNGLDKSQYELNQDAIQKAKEINQQRLEDSAAIKRQQELQQVLEEN